MDRFCGPVRGKYGTVVLYHETGIDILAQKSTPRALVVFTASEVQMPVYKGKNLITKISRLGLAVAFSLV